MEYGLPYKGSKNKLATRIVGILPQRKHPYDLFCGGCAITHAAMMTKKFQYFHINDINWMCPTLFRDVLNGKYDNETRWISREDFFRLKDTDPYVAFVWSFGNNLRDYIYGKDIEPIKKAIHYAMFYSDYSLAADMGHDLTFIDDIEDMQSRYLAIKHYFEAYGDTRMQSFEGGADYAARTLQQEPSPCSHGGGAKRLQIGNSRETATFPVKRPYEMQSHESSRQCARMSKKNCIHEGGRDGTLGTSTSRLQYRERHHSLPQGWQEALITSHGDYQDVEILPDSVIYCDIPYRNTNVYDTENAFNYKRFYDWACRQKEPVFISEYSMPEDRFEVVAEFCHRSILSADANNQVIERLFIPKGQKVMGTVQLRLFQENP